jgi:DNA-binding MarR family transcriptional regulator
MHPVTFAIKRTFQGALRVMRPWFQQFDLTPARFDMLYAISRHHRYFMLQSELRRVLGVSAPTVSRMLRSLEDLKWLTRRAYGPDRRERVIELTARGYYLLKRVILETIPRVAQLVVDAAFVLPWRPGVPQVSANLATLPCVLARAREQLRDFATLCFDEYDPVPAYPAGAPYDDDDDDESLIPEDLSSQPEL